MIWITLTEGELGFASFVACQRQTQNLILGRKDAYGCDPQKGWDTHIQGAAAELAVAKHLNRFWSGNLGDLKADDVGKLQVRQRSKHHWDLILHEADKDDRAYLLVTGLAPRFCLRGWIWGRDGKRPEYWKDPAGDRPAFFVPQSVLRKMT